MTVDTTEMRDMFCHPDAEHGGKLIHTSLNTVPVDKFEVLPIDYLPGVEQLTSNFISPCTTNCSRWRSCDSLALDLYQDRFVGEDTVDVVIVHNRVKKSRFGNRWPS